MLCAVRWGAPPSPTCAPPPHLYDNLTASLPAPAPPPPRPEHPNTPVPLQGRQDPLPHHGPPAQADTLLWAEEGAGQAAGQPGAGEQGGPPGALRRVCLPEAERSAGCCPQVGEPGAVGRLISRHWPARAAQEPACTCAHPLRACCTAAASLHTTCLPVNPPRHLAAAISITFACHAGVCARAARVPPTPRCVWVLVGKGGWDGGRGALPQRAAGDGLRTRQLPKSCTRGTDAGTARRNSLRRA